MAYIKILSQIAHGAFGEIFKAIDTTTNTELAIKIEKKQTVTQLKHEYTVYKLISGPGTPKVYEYGRVEYKGVFVTCMTMDLLGLSLEKVYNKLNREFSLKTIFMLGKTCLDKIEYLHHRHYVHRDIKPDNFVTDLSMKHVYLIDYGLSKEYRNPVTMVHRPYKDGKNLTGTARYASLNTHVGIEQSRRDDLESLGFLLVYFIKGRLPWQGLKAETKKAKYDRIFEVKRTTTVSELCKGCPDEIFLYMTHVRNLKYAEYPDYYYLTSLFENGLKKRGMEDDGKYDWLEKKEDFKIHK
ncbi:hypothetical protein NUSPORA_01584 [Nucleospora cyclopteri]